MTKRPRSRAGASKWVPDRGEMIWIDPSPQTGREMAGPHPFLVLSPRVFNERTGLVIGCAMTSRRHSNPFSVANPRDASHESVILAHQPKSFDWRARNARAHPWGRVPPAVLQDVCDRLNAIVQLA